jgi:hypothetical protein
MLVAAWLRPGWRSSAVPVLVHFFNLRQACAGQKHKINTDGAMTSDNIGGYPVLRSSVKS